MQAFIEIAVTFIVIGVCIFLFLGILNLMDVLDPIIRYTIKGECRHKFSKWSNVEHDRQTRVCEKCGWIEKAYR